MDPSQSSSPPEEPCSATPDSFTRRRFLCVSCGCGLAAPHVLAPSAEAAYGDPIDIGPVKGYTKDEISEKYIQHNFFVIRHKGRLYATTATCPHKQNFLFLNPENPREIICSGHDAVFDPEGRPLDGPVRRPLVRFAISVDKEGHARVDPFKEFPADQWEDPQSHLSLPAKA